MIDNKKLIVLWSAVVLAYVLLIVLTNPILMMSEARRRAAYAELTAAICEENLTALPEEQIPRPNQPLTVAESRVLERTAESLSMTDLTLIRIYQNGKEQGWEPAPCDSL